jgi:hypothetical protein
MPMFGSRILPPASDLPPQVSDAIAAREEAQRKLNQVQSELGGHQRVGVPAARRQDVEEAARASRWRH